MVATMSCPAALKEQALQRLSGLNLLWAFDLEGQGTIDAVVIARSLKRFDSKVFTDESVAALLDVLGAKPSSQDSDEPALVKIQQFADLVTETTESIKRHPTLSDDAIRRSEMTKSPSLRTSSGGTPRTPLVPRSPSCSRHAAVLDDYMDGLICDIDDFREAVHPEMIAAATGDSPEELLALKHELTCKAKEFMLEAQRKNIRPVWEAFDRDHDNKLSKDDCSKLVAAYLKALGPKSAEVLRSAIELGLELTVVMFEKRVEDPVARQQMREQAKKQVDAVHAKVAPLVKETLAKMAKEDPKEIASELLEDLHANQDGTVTREDFELRFVEAMQQVLGPERLMDKLHRGRSSA
jgi:Ca2+-binding EF-hand superfamily protein|eukprot:TRINITY_DN69227_c0_g1_i1.p1 TRINITY_DN69227_c0_g1~~TRINITY_DN69227_c0_g1_i1.p1  ORF type:complete len:393 (-),score=76.45 TRINITY_DN69227_c0_g1_i1:282-1337(-)